MQWYFARGGDTSNRGLVDEDTLKRMAREGELTRSDLVWNKDGNDGWISASLVPGLFPEQSSDSTEKHALPQTEEKQGEETPGNRKNPGLNKLIAVLGILAALMTCAVVSTVLLEIKRKRMAEIDEQAPPSPEVVRSNKVIELSAAIDECLDDQDVSNAHALWMRLKEYDDTGATASIYSNRISSIRAVFREIDGLSESLESGTLSTNGAVRLIELYQERGGSNAVRQLALNTLSTNSPPAQSLSAARLLLAIGDTDSALKALDRFRVSADYRGSARPYLESADMLYRLGKPEVSAGILASYLENQTENGEAWLELASIQCAGVNPDATMSSLKKAIEYGGNDIRRKAVKEPRLDPVKDKWRFGWWTKIRD